MPTPRPDAASPDRRILLQLLGGLGVVGVDGRPHPTLAAQPKRAALLATLALGGRGTLLRRDQLVARLWPEMPTDRARAALRRGLSHLRAALGAETLVTQGDEVVGLDPSRVDCDLWTLVDTLDAGRPADGLPRYLGDLLAGFHVDDVAEWEQWVDGERLRLRQRVVGAATGLARAAVAAAEFDEAVRWARWAVAHDAADEGALRVLLDALVAAGDPAAALREYERYATWLRSEFDAEPSEATAAIVRRARQRPAPTDRPSRVAPAFDGGAATDPSVAQSLASASEPAERGGPVATESTAPSPPTATVQPATEQRARGAFPPRVRRRRADAWTLTAGVAVVAAVAVILGGLARQPTRQTDTRASALATVNGVAGTIAGEARLALFPFDVRGGGASMAYLSDGVVELMAAQLDGTAGIRVVDPRQLAPAAGGDPHPESVAEALAIARRADAPHFVLGAAVATEGRRLALIATIYDTEGRVVARVTSPPVEERDLFAAVDSLSRHVVSTVATTSPQSLGAVATVTTPSLPALRRYLAGERLFATGRFADAARAYAEATTFDSTFALAWFRLSRTLDWGGNVQTDMTAAQAAANAARFSTRLPARDRLLLQAYLHQQRAMTAAADSEFRVAATRYPDDFEVWHQWGELRNHSGHEVVEPMRSAAPLFERVLAIDSTNVSARLHLARLAALGGRVALFDSLSTWLTRRAPAHESLFEFAVLAATLHGDRGAIDRLVAESMRVPATDVGGQNRVLVVAWRVALIARDLPTALRLARALDVPDRPAEVRLMSRLAQAQLLAGAGQWRATADALTSAARLDPLTADETQASLAAFIAPAGALATPSAFLPESPIRASDTTRSLPRGGTEQQMALREQAALRPALRPFLRGVLAVNAGRLDRAREELALLTVGARALDSAHVAQGAALALELRAWIARATGDRDGAARAADDAWRRTPRFASLFAYPLPTRLLLHAAIDRDRGRPDQALRWCDAADLDIGLGESTIPTVERCRAELRSALGDASGAARARAVGDRIVRQGEAAFREVVAPVWRAPRRR